MPIQGIIQPDDTIAGGVIFEGQSYTVGHNFLTGNTQGKIDKIKAAMLDVLDVRIHIDDLPLDDPDHPDNNPEFNEYANLYQNNGELISEKQFFYRQNPQNLFLVFRNIVPEVELVTANDPSLGGEDRYNLSFNKL